MPAVEPLRALRYDPRRAGPLPTLVAPPYDVIDTEQRAALAARSPHNVVHVDLPEAPPGEDRYAAAAALLARWRDEGAVVRDERPALWALAQDYTGPDGRAATRRGFLARVRVEDYGPGRVRAHERTHPGPKEDRLRLTRATRANLSPIFSLFSDPAGAAWAALEPATAASPWGEVSDDDGTVHRVWRVADPAAVAAASAVASDTELLIADGHHRYETARAYADEVGGEGEHRFVLMHLVALEDPGLLVFPTHRLLRGLDDTVRQEALAAAIRRDWEIAELGDPHELVPHAGPADDGRVSLGYMDRHFRRPFRLTLKDQALADAALPGRPGPYRRLDTAVLEALLLKGALGMSDDDISHQRGLGYARDDEQAIRAVLDGEADAAFYVSPTPVSRIQEVASTGEAMPPKSTYFFPKVPTGLVFNPLA